MGWIVRCWPIRRPGRGYRARGAVRRAVVAKATVAASVALPAAVACVLVWTDPLGNMGPPREPPVPDRPPMPRTPQPIPAPGALPVLVGTAVLVLLHRRIR